MLLKFLCFLSQGSLHLLKFWAMACPLSINSTRDTEKGLLEVTVGQIMSWLLCVLNCTGLTHSPLLIFPGPAQGRIQSEGNTVRLSQPLTESWRFGAFGAAHCSNLHVIVDYLPF